MAVETERHETYTILHLDWPETRNAMGPDEAGGLLEALHDGLCDDTRSVILAARGKSFCAGGDLAAISRIARQGEAAVEALIYNRFQKLLRTIHDFPVPIIAAVDGAAIGFGADLALAADLTFIGSQGWLAQGWARAGLVPATGGTWSLARAGRSAAVWRLLANRKTDGPAAEKLGLGVAVEDAISEAVAVAVSLGEFRPDVVRATRQLSKIEDFDLHLKTALDLQKQFLCGDHFQEYAQEVLRSKTGEGQP